ncbi:hypothetical protein SELMODRAFT_170108 [Selaginella moellendorffii]|uniref:SAUR family protein n=1 Tax=Selaginella moellendorffii TaxID=88036 RepID=D8RC11_SELML|nr:auxin-responsive protein SAUR71 [Selaginella moellendorffii]XP_002989983.1 auxin-responsive protein SAUR71 [Selaginella moellendorffii]EFJ08996.1 hypothetical protein SELMODRAFT_130753 [Selaginella moellendorffii]EFJ30052.1 hypothetical protein SELMODRAFT_170108 [Selaginella moellendorffii]|eukprot:XP_002968936.1 auxin-responsive protein SAUR71 [Selaginella moellendorffii]
MAGSASSKVKRIVDKWQKKLKRSGRSYASLESASPLSTCASDLEEFDHKQQPQRASKIIAKEEARAPEDAFVVYVGKEARRYVVEARHLKHPLFKSFVQKSAASNLEEEEEEDALVRISCEVVMFEHLLWTLENYDPAELHGEALNELLDMYATS